MLQLFIVFTVLVHVATAIRPTWKELNLNYTFENYVLDFSLDLSPESDEWKYRQGLFNKELTRVLEHNMKNLSWKEGVNKFTVYSESERQTMFGRSKGY